MTDPPSGGCTRPKTPERDQFFGVLLHRFQSWERRIFDLIEQLFYLARCARNEATLGVSLPQKAELLRMAAEFEASARERLHFQGISMPANDLR